jgi:hypothetical protein
MAAAIPLRVCALVLVALAFHVQPAFTQSFQGGLRGAVRDADGVLPGVALTLSDTSTGAARAAETNADGEYVFSAVPPGTYRLSGELGGYKRVSRDGLSIGPQDFLTVDVVLEVGGVEETISVTAGSPVLESSNASTGQRLDKQALETLPNAGRNAFMMALTVPNVIPTGNPTFNRQQDQTNASLVSLAGGPVRANNYLLDGVPITDLRNRPVMMPSIEALQEVKVQVSTFDAEMGRTGGGVFNTVGRSGTNEFHGSAFVQNRPEFGTANNFFSNRAGIPLAPFYFWLYGGSAGGPIRKGRTFFWASTEGYRQQSQLTGTLTMPTALERQGDFSQTVDAQGRQVVIYDPLTTRPNPNGTGFIRDPFPGNRIPAERLNGVGLALVNQLPSPDPGRGRIDGQDNYVRSGVLSDAADQATLKVDHRFSDSLSLSGMYAWYDSREPNALYYDGLPGDPNAGALYRTVHALAFNGTKVMGSTSVLTMRYGYNSFVDDDVPETAGFDLTSLGFAPAFADQVAYDKFPRVTFEGFGSLGDRAPQDTTYFSHNANLTYARYFGRHNLRLGADYRQIAMDMTAYGQSSGSFAFTRGFTQGPNPNVSAINAGNAVASLLLGYPASGTVTVGTPTSVALHYYAGYLQDDIRVTPSLTINAGLRYEFETGLREAENRITVGFDRNAVSPLAAQTGLDVRGGLVYAGVDGARDYLGDDRGSRVAPRVGLAWTLGTRTVVRGGYGLFYAPTQYPFPSETSYGTQGYTAITDYFASADGGLTPAGSVSNPFPTGIAQPVGNTRGLLQQAGGTVHFVDQTKEAGRVQQYSVDVQRELPWALTLTVGYIGSRSDRLTVGGTADATVNINQLPVEALALGAGLQQLVPNPFFGLADAGALGRQATIARGQLLRPYPQFLDVLAHQVSAGKARYNAGVVKLERRPGDGFGFRASYTYSRAMDNIFGESNYYADRTATPLDNYALDGEYALAINDIPHRLLVAPTWELPFGAGRRWLSGGGLIDAVFGGWSITGISTWQSGFPSAIVQSNNNIGTLGGRQRPNLVAGVEAATSGDPSDRVNGWFNADAFALAAPFTLGTAPRTLAVRGPGQFNVDLSIAKTVQVTSGLRAMLRVEAINATNTPKFRSPDLNFGSSTFGRITAQAGFARQLQVMARFFW